MLRALHAHLVRDNPVWIHFHRRAWRRYRRWGWALILLPALLILPRVFFEALYIASGYNPSPGPDLPFVGICLLAAYAFSMLYLVFALGGMARLFRPDNMEELLLARITPGQLWSAVWLNYHRNLLVTLGVLAPVSCVFALLGNVPLSSVLRQAGVWIAYTEVWALGLLSSAMQRGLRFHRFTALSLLVIYVGGAVALMIALASEGDLEFGRIPLLLSPNPLMAMQDDFLRVATGPEARNWGGLDTTLIALGWDLPFWPSMTLLFALVAAALAAHLLAGPLGLPAHNEALLGMAGGGALARAMESPVMGAAKPGRFPWLYIMDRIYENSPRWLRSRRDLLKLFAGSSFWLILLLALVEAWTTGMDFAGQIRQFPHLRWTGYIILFCVFGLLAGLHLTPSPTGTPPPVRRYRRAGTAYLVKMAILGAVLALSLYSPISRRAAFPDAGYLMKGLAFVSLILANQALFQLWASGWCKSLRQSIGMSILHVAALWLFTQAFVVLAPILLDFFGEAPARIAIGISSISPAIGLWAFLDEFHWRVPSMGVRNVNALITQDADWRVSAGCLAIEGVLLLLLWARRQGRRAVG